MMMMMVGRCGMMMVEEGVGEGVAVITVLTFSRGGLVGFKAPQLRLSGGLEFQGQPNKIEMAHRLPPSLPTSLGHQQQPAKSQSATSNQPSPSRN